MKKISKKEKQYFFKNGNFSRLLLGILLIMIVIELMIVFTITGTVAFHYIDVLNYITIIWASAIFPVLIIEKIYKAIETKVLIYRIIILLFYFLFVPQLFMS